MSRKKIEGRKVLVLLSDQMIREIPGCRTAFIREAIELKIRMDRMENVEIKKPHPIDEMVDRMNKEWIDSHNINEDANSEEQEEYRKILREWLSD